MHLHLIYRDDWKDGRYWIKNYAGIVNIYTVGTTYRGGWVVRDE